MSNRESLTIELRVGEQLSIDNGRVVMTLKEKSGQRARLHFSADENINIEPVRSRPATIAAQEGINIDKAFAG